MFIENKYKRIYYRIITKARNENRSKKSGDYYENHHIIPKSMRGTDKKENLVLLTPKEHFLCHRLLVKMVDKNSINYHKMVKALRMFSIVSRSNNHRKFSALQYEILRKAHYEDLELVKKNPYYRKRISDTLKEGYASGRIKSARVKYDEKGNKIEKPLRRLKCPPMSEVNRILEKKEKIKREGISLNSPWKEGQLVSRNEVDAFRKLFNKNDSKYFGLEKFEIIILKKYEKFSRIEEQIKNGIERPVLNKFKKKHCVFCNETVTDLKYKRYHGEKCRFYINQESQSNLD